jgi:hypothetical protein
MVKREPVETGHEAPVDHVESHFVIRRTIVGAGCLVALAACASPAARGAPGPVAAPSSAHATSSAATPIPLPSISPHPAPATLATPQGAAEFIRAYYAELDRALQLGDATVLDEYFTATAPFKQKVDRETSEMRAKGHHRTSEHRKITKILADTITPVRMRLFIYSNWQPIQELTSTESVVGGEPARKARERQDLEFRSGRWWIGDSGGEYTIVSS